MKLVILDRDGVINEDSDAFIKSVEEWVPLPGSIEAIARLSQTGFTVVVATNQSGVGRGLFSEQTLDAMHDKLRQLVANAGGQLGNIYHCPHRPDDGCHCRKPAPGLLDAIARDYPSQSPQPPTEHSDFQKAALPQGPLTGTPLVGDSLRDLEAGVVHGCLPILVRTGKGRATESKLADAGLTGVVVFDDLAAAVDYLLEQGKQ